MFDWNTPNFGVRTSTNRQKNKNRHVTCLQNRRKFSRFFYVNKIKTGKFMLPLSSVTNSVFPLFLLTPLKHFGDSCPKGPLIHGHARLIGTSIKAQTRADQCLLDLLYTHSWRKLPKLDARIGTQEVLRNKKTTLRSDSRKTHLEPWGRRAVRQSLRDLVSRGETEQDKAQ